jgi:hypothetical protein
MKNRKKINLRNLNKGYSYYQIRGVMRASQKRIDRTLLRKVTTIMTLELSHLIIVMIM